MCKDRIDGTSFSSGSKKNIKRVAVMRLWTGNGARQRLVKKITGGLENTREILQINTAC